MSLARPRTFAAALALATLGACTTETAESASRSPSAAALPEQERVTSPPATLDGGTSAGPVDGAAGTPLAFRLPTWAREDVQPKSARFGETYGLDAFTGKTVVVVLLEGQCPFCRSNAVVAQNLHDELRAEGLDVQIVVLGDPSAEELASRASLPIFRDSDRMAWDEMRANASKHDTFVFAPNGERTYFWPGSYQGDATRWRADIGAAVRSVARPGS
jgi:hypothetical protein